MDEFSWAPFTPPLAPLPDEPMGMDDGFGMQPNDWQQNECDSFPFLDPVGSSAIAEDNTLPYTGWNLQLPPTTQADNPLSSANLPCCGDTSHSVDDGATVGELLDPTPDCEDHPMRSMTIEANIAKVGPSPTQLPFAGSSYSLSENPISGPPTTTSNTHDQTQLGGAEIPRLADLPYLESLPHSVLKEISKNVAEALNVAEQKATQRSREQETPPQLPEGRLPKNAATGSNNVLRCEQPGCKTTFRHNKDRLRHVRQKHTTDVKTFSCPVIDCPMGHGHKFHRSDKLRDHLRGERISSLEWCCVVPGCSDIVATRVGLIDHLGQHDFETRRSNGRLFADYGFTAQRYLDYLDTRYICSIHGCPFGTDNEAVMLGHLSIPHDGPSCPCPMPSCGETFQDWLQTSRHLARAHDYDTRVRFRREVSLRRYATGCGTVLCPICDHEIINATMVKVRAHWQKHDYEQRLQASEALTEAVVFALGSYHSLREDLLGKRYREWTIRLNDDKLFPYMILPDAEFNKLRTDEDFKRAGAELRASIELRKKGEQS